MSFIWNFSIYFAALVVVVISKWWYRWSNPKCNGKLPPGSMGFPIIGETIAFFEPHGLYEIFPFIKKRMLRYGPMFRTNIFGSNTVILTDPDVIFEVFRQENKSFIFGYPDSFVKVFGKGNLLAEQGSIHKHGKQATLHFIGSDGLKRKMIGDMDRVIREDLKSKASQGSFDVKETLSNCIISVLIPKMISNLKPETQKNLIDSFKPFNLDWFQSFLKFSTWISLYKALVARRATVVVINGICLARKESTENYEDFLASMEENIIFNEKSIISNIFSLSVVAKDSTSTAISLAVKFIAENLKVLSELKREHDTIIRERYDKESGISWEEYKNKMTFTNMVISESLRLANMAPLLFRKVVHDVEIKGKKLVAGYLIPAGWTVAVAPSIIHYDPTIYENPLEFNPWRWEGQDLVNGSKKFMVFGGGVRLCPGAAFVRLQMAIFIHHLVTNYQFFKVQECEVTRTPLICLPNGINLDISCSPTSSFGGRNSK